ncbi:ankyrin repeat-containing domain protein [Mycena rebaudengoi]|nr:ankyrin repeat-containing domain protein [Mycena rebaudengoi]
MKTPRILTKTFWNLKAQKPGPVIQQVHSLQEVPAIESKDMKETLNHFKQSRAPSSSHDPNAERTPVPDSLDSASPPTLAARDTKPAHRTGTVIGGLVLATSIVESISGAIDQVPLVGPVVALLFHISKKCREVKDMHEQRDVLVAQFAKRAGDLHGTIMLMEANNHTDSTGRLKTDIEEYVGFKTSALQTEWASKFTALNRELDLFGARFNIEQDVIYKKVDHSHITNLKEKLEKWLKSADMSEKQHETQKLHHEGTGIWFLNGRQLTEWIEKPGSLWIEGNWTTKSNWSLRSVVFQLSGQSPNPYGALDAQYGKLSQGQTLPTTRDLLERLTHWDHWKPRAEDIIAKVAEKINGMFRLAACLLIDMSHPKLNPNLDAILANLPNELYGIYDRFLETVGADDIVYDSLAFDFSNPHLHVYDPSKRGNNARSLCGFLEGLVIVRESAEAYTSELKVVASLAHASVADYLASNKFVKPGQCNLDSKHSHTFLASYQAVIFGPSLSDVCRTLLEPSSAPLPRPSCSIDIDRAAPRYREGVGADANAGGWWYQTALQAVSAKGHTDIICALLENGADINQVGRGFGGALQAAAARGHTEVVGILPRDATGDHMEVVGILCEKGADVNAAGGRYGSALQAASYKSHPEIIQILIEKGADVNAVGGEYGSALQAAAADGNTEVVGILCEKGADVNAVGEYYGIALQAASH